jgi:hypothetical protein
MLFCLFDGNWYELSEMEKPSFFFAEFDYGIKDSFWLEECCLTLPNEYFVRCWESCITFIIPLWLEKIHISHHYCNAARAWKMVETAGFLCFFTKLVWAQMQKRVAFWGQNNCSIHCSNLFIGWFFWFLDWFLVVMKTVTVNNFNPLACLWHISALTSVGDNAFWILSTLR